MPHTSPLLVSMDCLQLTARYLALDETRFVSHAEAGRGGSWHQRIVMWMLYPIEATHQRS